MNSALFSFPKLSRVSTKKWSVSYYGRVGLRISSCHLQLIALARMAGYELAVLINCNVS